MKSKPPLNVQEVYIENKYIHTNGMLEKKIHVFILSFSIECDKCLHYIYKIWIVT